MYLLSTQDNIKLSLILHKYATLQIIHHFYTISELTEKEDDNRLKSFIKEFYSSSNLLHRSTKV